VTGTAEWVVVIPVKATDAAKTRLAVEGRRDLALAFALDAVAVARAATGVAAVCVVTSDSLAASAVTAVGAEVVADPEPGAHIVGPAAGAGETGLDAAVRAGAAAARRRRPGAALAALPADLPALTADELADALALAGGHPRAVVGDTAGIGTTLLTALAGERLVPRFGGSSFARHVASGHAPLPAGPGLRRDVDTSEELAAAIALGVGPHTRGALGWRAG